MQGAGAGGVRAATVGDADGLWRLLAARSDRREPFLERLHRMLASGDHAILVAVRGSDVLGYAWAQDYGPHLRDGRRTARFHDLFVAEGARRQGVGRRLVEAVVDWSRMRGVSWLQWQSSPTAVGFYERLGLQGDPCPQPDHPFFEVEFPATPGPSDGGGAGPRAPAPRA